MNVGSSMWRKVCDGGRWRNTERLGSGVVDARFLGVLGFRIRPGIDGQEETVDSEWNVYAFELE